MRGKNFLFRLAENEYKSCNTKDELVDLFRGQFKPRPQSTVPNPRSVENMSQDIAELNRFNLQ